MKKNIVPVLAVALVFVLGFAVIASADDGALADFNAQYPANSLGSSCNICHQGVPATNPYGTVLVNQGATGNDIPAATFLAVGGVDSDGDGFTNTEEIKAGFFPGNPASHPSAPGITITTMAPNGGEAIASGSTFTILYDAPAEVTSVKVRYSLDGGATWLRAVGTSGAGSFDWEVPTPVKNTRQALVRVIGFNASNVKLDSDISDARFGIEVVSIAAPVPDEIVPKGSAYSVTWTTNGTKAPVSSAKVFYTLGSSGIWKPANGTVLDPLGSFSWNVPSPANSKIVKLKIVLKDASGVTVGNVVSQPFLVQ